MSLQTYMNTLIEDSRRTDAQPEEDLRQYARLLVSLKQHKENEERCKAEVQDFAKIFELFEMPKDSKQSVHAKEIEQESGREHKELLEIESRIELRKVYYTALEAGDYTALWSGEDEVSHIGAIYQVFRNEFNQTLSETEKSERFQKGMEVVRRFLNDRTKFNETLSRYLIEKLLISCEQDSCPESHREAMYELAGELLEQFSHSSTDNVWRCMERCVGIRKSEKLFADFDVLWKEYQSILAGLDDFISAYRTSESNMTEELEKLCSGRLGKRGTESATRARNWLHESIDQMHEDIKKCQRQDKAVKKDIKSIEAARTTLQAGLEEGTDKATIAKLAQELTSLKNQFQEYTPVSSLEEKQRQQMDELTRQISMVQNAMNTDAETTLKIRRLRLQVRENKRNRKRNWRINHPILNILRWVPLVIMLWWIVMDRTAWWYAKTPWEMQRNTLVWKEGDMNYNPSYIEAMLCFGDCVLELEWGDAKKDLERYYLRRSREALVSADGVLEIPSEVAGVEVKAVNVSFMPGEVTKIVFPDTVEELWGYMGTGNLQVVEAPSVITVGAKVFENCENLNKIDLTAVKVIEASAFEGCVGLTEAKLDNVETIGERAFRECTGLKEISLPKATTIGDAAFAYDTALYKVSAPYVTVLRNVFTGCTSLKIVELPAAEMLIETFKDCVGLEEVNLPMAQEMSATFYGCTGLKKVTLPAMKVVGQNCFENCSSLTEIDLSAVTSILYKAFSGCTNLAEVNLSTVKSVREFAFSGCTALKEIVFGEEDTNIYAAAFEKCTGLEKVVIPNAKEMGDCVFSGCSNLKQVYFFMPSSWYSYMGINVFPRDNKNLEFYILHQYIDNSYTAMKEIYSYNMPVTYVNSF